MYVATLGIAIVGALSVSLAAQAQESKAAKAASDFLQCPVGGMCRCAAGKQTAAKALANTSLQRERDAAFVL